jgi:flagellar export protein FliJ
MSKPIDAAVRWRKQQLDDLRRNLGALFKRQEELQHSLEAINTELESEMLVANGMALANFSAFHARNRTSHGQTLQQLDAIEQEIDALRAHVTAAFEDYKAVDVAAERQREALRLEERLSAQAAMDDMAAQRHGGSSV